MRSNASSPQPRSRAWVWCLAGILGVSSWAPSASASLLSDAQLFLDPWQVPEAVYPSITLVPTWDGVNLDNNRFTWPQNDMENVQVVPLLEPFSPTDPAGYPAGHVFSQDDYRWKPNEHYTVDLTSGVATATFHRAGVYHVRVDRPGTVNDQTYAVLFEAGMLNGVATGASVAIDGPRADLVVVSDPTEDDSTLDNAADNAVDDNGEAKVRRVDSAGDLVSKIQTASQNAGRKLHVELVCHGAPGQLWIGDTEVGAGGMTIAELQAALDEYVDNLSIYACSFARGAAGQAALQTLADSIGRASGFTVPVSVHRSWWLGWLVGGDWDLLLGGRNVVIPEPASLVLIALTAGLLIRRREQWVG